MTQSSDQPTPDRPALAERYACTRCGWSSMASSLADAQQQHWEANVLCTHSATYSSVERAPSAKPLGARVEEIERLARAATPGPWKQTQNMRTGVKLWGADDSPLFAIIATVDHSRITSDDPTPQWQKDCDFVRACSPEVILSLLAALRSASATPPRTDCKNRACQLVADMVGTLEATLIQWRERAIAAESGEAARPESPAEAIVVCTTCGSTVIEDGRPVHYEDCPKAPQGKARRMWPVLTRKPPPAPTEGTRHAE